MEGELIEIREFLARCPPFDGLPETVLDGLPYRLMVRYLRRGSPFPPGEDDPALWLIRGGAVEFRGPDQQLIEKLGEGELHFDACLDAPTLPGQQGKVVEDSLFYLLPCSELQLLRQQHGEFSQYFEQDLRSRLQ
ncbi:MAG: cyclic nucleotide-binding/CBS domain-containing protein, partial [Gammaproteobacteria bacterium]|nr:cyclic nucleotide-binding/CBS domain-containing protein [Gammaproteobacteria bacterium]